MKFTPYRASGLSEAQQGQLLLEVWGRGEQLHVTGGNCLGLGHSVAWGAP